MCKCLKSIFSGERYQRTDDQGRDLGAKDEKQVPGGLILMQRQGKGEKMEERVG